MSPFRFVFADHSSIKLNNKLKFPLHDLDISPYIAPESFGKYQNLYDLYSCVCHFGSKFLFFKLKPVERLAYV